MMMMRRSRSLQPISTVELPPQSQDEACFVEPLHCHHHQHNKTRTPSTPATPQIGLDNEEHQAQRFDFLSRLPIEISLYILLILATEHQPKDLLNCRLVSKTWQTFAQDNLIWKQSFFIRKQWKIKSTLPQQQQQQHDHQPIPHITRRLSQLIGLPNSLVSSTPSPVINQDLVHHQPELNWLTLFKDRSILDTRWRDGTQVSRKLKGHQDSVYCLQMDDHQIITGSRDRTIKVWDTKTRECRRTLVGHKGSVLCVRYDATVLLSGSSDSSVFVWDKSSWKVKMELVGHRSGVLDLAISPTSFVSCSKDTTIKIWNRFNGELLRTITGHSGPVNALELSTLSLPTLLSPSGSSTSTEGSRGLLSASGDSTMKLWELETGKLLRTYEGHLRGLACLKLVEQDRQIITGSNDETIKIWNLITTQCLRTLLGHSGLVRSLDFSLQHNRLVSGSYDKTIKVWDLKTGQLLLDFRKGTDRNLVFDVKFNLKSIVSVGHPNSIMLLDFADGLEADKFI
ncbi:hypothetical protein PSTG_07810 [Puccinia striiformis f. sp. tritici PST-78]|uniref:F-box domain-containing protein n=1 Tax=Puccinia striiformis f. sp. tritici PST-78 TaxID=1165861 RepID=A0A0L0VID8_9BASI|nr:hypothetical protein PSTG_07810 [Puccinia striiformis f. sp. tritici PST-78]